MKIHILFGSQLVVQARVLEHDPERPPHLVRFLDRVMAVNNDLPDVGINKVVNILIVVDFPAPLGPRNAKISPWPTLKLISLTAVKSPNFFVRFFTSIIFMKF